MVGAAGSVSSLILSGLLKILINRNRIVILNPGLVTYLGVLLKKRLKSLRGSSLVTLIIYLIQVT